jgi:protease-4
MNTFFKSFFASLLALLVFCILVFLIIGGIISSLSKSLEKEAVKTEPNSVLVLDLNYAIPEQSYRNVAFPNPLSGEPMPSTGLNDILRAVKAAETDKNIKGIAIKMGVNQNGYATLQEVRDALFQFRKNSGKFIVSYGEMVNQSAYYLGSVADEVYVHPSGYFEFKGLAAQLTFIKGTLDKLGIRTQVFWAGEFKSATEPLRLDKMSEQNREQLRSYVGGLYQLVLQDISQSRKLSIDSLSSIATHLSAWSLKDAVAVGMIDGLMYADEWQAMLDTKTGADETPAIALSDYVRGLTKETGNWDSQIAVIYAEGNIVDGRGEFGSIGSVSFREILQDVREDEEIKAVVIRVNSGGGSALASDVIWREIELLKKEKPVVVSMGDYAASGGYMIACNASKVYARPTTLTGSIGVFFILPEVSGFMENKLGMTTDTVLTEAHADFPSLVRGTSEAETAQLQKMVDDTYMAFKQQVADGRNMEIEQVEALAKGRIRLGTTALDLGLVDALGGLQDAIEAAAELAGLESYRTTDLPRQELEFWEELMIDLSEETTTPPVLESLGALMEPYQAVRSYIEHPVVRAELPFLLEMK